MEIDPRISSKILEVRACVPVCIHTCVCVPCFKRGRRGLASRRPGAVACFITEAAGPKRHCAAHRNPLASGTWISGMGHAVPGGLTSSVHVHPVALAPPTHPPTCPSIRLLTPHCLTVLGRSAGRSCRAPPSLPPCARESLHAAPEPLPCLLPPSLCLCMQLRRKAKEHLGRKEFEESLGCLDIAIDLHASSYKVGEHAHHACAPLAHFAHFPDSIIRISSADALCMHNTWHVALGGSRAQLRPYPFTATLPPLNQAGMACLNRRSALHSVLTSNTRARARVHAPHASPQPRNTPLPLPSLFHPAPAARCSCIGCAA